MLSLFLYGLVFYFYQQSTIIKPQRVNSGEQSIQLKVITTKLTEISEEAVPLVEAVKDQQQREQEQIEEKQATETKETTTEEDPIAEVKEPIIVEEVIENAEPKTTEIVAVINSTTTPSEIKIASEHSARDDAALKGELFDKPFNLNLPAPPGSHKATRYADDKIIIPAVTVSSTTEKQSKKAVSSIQKEATKKKTKRVFKKENSSAKEQGVLQEAIVISGNKPTYPQRAILREQQGRVVVKLTVTMQGKAKNPQITRSSGFPILDDAVLNFIKNERFMPAHKGNEKITTEQLFSFRFELK